MMPDLPNVGVERDMESFKEFFESPSFRADGLKIYPTLVIRGTGLYELWKTGRYNSPLCFFFVGYEVGNYVCLKHVKICSVTYLLMKSMQQNHRNGLNL